MPKEKADIHAVPKARPDKKMHRAARRTDDELHEMEDKFRAAPFEQTQDRDGNRSNVFPSQLIPRDPYEDHVQAKKDLDEDVFGRRMATEQDMEFIKRKRQDMEVSKPKKKPSKKKTTRKKTTTNKRKRSAKK
jgi:hypothetical protein